MTNPLNVQCGDRLAFLVTSLPCPRLIKSVADDHEVDHILGVLTASGTSGSRRPLWTWCAIGAFVPSGTFLAG